MEERRRESKAGERGLTVGGVEKRAKRWRGGRERGGSGSGARSGMEKKRMRRRKEG